MGMVAVGDAWPSPRWQPEPEWDGLARRLADGRAVVSVAAELNERSDVHSDSPLSWLAAVAHPQGAPEAEASKSRQHRLVAPRRTEKDAVAFRDVSARHASESVQGTAAARTRRGLMAPASLGRPSRRPRHFSDDTDVSGIEISLGRGRRTVRVRTENANRLLGHGATLKLAREALGERFEDPGLELHIEEAPPWTVGPEVGVPSLENDQWTFEGRVERLDAFSSGVTPARGWKRVIGLFLVLAMLAPMAFVAVLWLLQLVL